MRVERGEEKDGADESPNWVVGEVRRQEEHAHEGSDEQAKPQSVS